ncbi:MAG: DUF6502 family protein [Aquabacterium sp.]
MSQDVPTGGDDAVPGGDALLQTVKTLLAPLARLAVSHGLPYANVEEAVREAFIDAARASLLEQGLAPHRMVSRISTITGINRREVTRLTRSEADILARRYTPSTATEVFTKWVTDVAYKAADGHACPLKRLGPAPSFESLARAITQDVHPRSVLDELVRLGLARIDEDTDMVHLLTETFVPGGDRAHMLGFLAANVGDHLSAAVDNVTAKKGPRFFEQAVFSDELAEASMPVLHALVSRHWKALMDEAVPLMEQRIEADKADGALQNKRIRIGLYSYHEDVPPNAQPEANQDKDGGTTA